MSEPATGPLRTALGLAGVAALCLLVCGLILKNHRDGADEPDLAAAAQADLAQRNYRPLSAPLTALLTDAKYAAVPTQTHPLLGESAPDFTLPAVLGDDWSLRTALEKGPVVVVFYYGYHCDHCVSQLFGLNQDLAYFTELGAQVVAISGDPTAVTRERFQQYGKFTFPVLSDGDNRVATLYGTYAAGRTPEEPGNQVHGTFVLDRTGRVVWVNRGSGPFTENHTLLRELKTCLERK
jgi:peroxiredoxin